MKAPAPDPVASPLRFGPWLLLERIGLGGTAEIFRAQPLAAPRASVALKRLLPMYRDHATVRAMMRNEIKMLQRVQSPRVAQLLSHGNHNRLIWLTMPHYPGAALADVLRAGPLPVEVALHVAVAIAAALADVHAAGVVHGDVSPGNVLLRPDGRVVLLDFGLARRLRARPPQRPPRLRGNWPYLAPEQISGARPDPRSDFFSLGALLGEMASGQPLFVRATRAATLAAVQGAVRQPSPEPALETVLDAFLQSDCRARPADARAAMALLAAGLRDAQTARLALRARIRSAAALRSLPLATAAELRGEAVTDPGVDPTATLLRRLPVAPVAEKAES